MVGLAGCEKRDRTLLERPLTAPARLEAGISAHDRYGRVGVKTRVNDAAAAEVA